jgi:hypothetical protein
MPDETSPLHYLTGVVSVTSLATCGFSKSYVHAAQVPSSRVTDKVPRNPAKKEQSYKHRILVGANGVSVHRTWNLQNALTSS